jgi:hypothetical protein
MSAQESLWLEDQQGLFPMGEATGQDEEPEAVGSGQTGFLDLAVEEDQLLAEQSILCDQFGSTEREIGGRAHEEGRASGLSKMSEGLVQQKVEVGEEAE